MDCKWENNDCKNNNIQCHVCVTQGMNYLSKQNKPKSQLNKRQAKPDKRMGSGFEYKNHQNNVALLSGASSGMTLNSGATPLAKGDEQISGIISIMEELKTKITQKALGKESFTIKKEWLLKLNREAKVENKEFWYLKFSFLEHDEDIFVITEQDIIMSMVLTMVEDRKKANRADAIVDVAEKRRQKIETDLISAQAEIALLKAELKLNKILKEELL